MLGPRLTLRLYHNLHQKSINHLPICRWSVNSLRLQELGNVEHNDHRTADLYFLGVQNVPFP
jgi:hypothetical protein